MVIRDLPVKTIQMLKEIYKRQYNPSKHTLLETFALDMSIVDDKARTDRQHFLWLIGMYYKDVLWAKNKMEPWVVKATEDVKSGNLVCPDRAAMDRANKVGMKNELPFRGDANIGKYPIVFIVDGCCVQFSITIHWLFQHFFW